MKLSDLHAHPILILPPEAVVLDLTRVPLEVPPTPWSVGRYDELRPGMYTTDLFAGGRCLHVGLDLGGPAGTAIHAPLDGRILHAGYNSADGDYGHVLVSAHPVDTRTLYILYGHLSAASLATSPVGREVSRGEVLGWLGAEHENGGWPPHVHIQLCWERPDTHDMPGTVHPSEREEALLRYPDPCLLLGKFY